VAQQVLLERAVHLVRQERRELLAHQVQAVSVEPILELQERLGLQGHLVQLVVLEVQVLLELLVWQEHLVLQELLVLEHRELLEPVERQEQEDHQERLERQVLQVQVDLAEQTQVLLVQVERLGLPV
jgi:hypothetical protein